MKSTILVIEDDSTINMFLIRYLTKMGHLGVGVSNLAEADEYLESNEVDLIVTDYRLPDGDCLSRLPDFVQNQPVIILTAYGSVDNAVQAMKMGASEYITKPISGDEFELVVNKTLQNAAIKNDHQFCKQRMQAKENINSFIIGKSQRLDEVKKLIEAVAPNDITVLILGESGAGKELVAHAIHKQSNRSSHNFVAVDCCTIQEKLFESELFGHEKGSFTGADKQKKGLIEGAENGTLFLDEIGEINPAIQAKLLRVLETGKYRRVGGNKDLSANVRIVAATNRNLEKMSKEGNFRMDLYYRLEAFSITTPALRDRREDIPFLVEHFIRNHNFSRRINKYFTKEALRKLTAYDWPGNVRELKNVVERAIILSQDQDTIKVDHLTFGSQSEAQKPNIKFCFDHDPTLDELERCYFEMTMKKFSGHRSLVAETLGISERNVYRLIQKYDL